jgi:hypothetical protein
MSEKGLAKPSYNTLFFQEFNIVNLPSEKVYFSGLNSLWPEITRIPNIPLVGFGPTSALSGLAAANAGKCTVTTLAEN